MAAPAAAAARRRDAPLAAAEVSVAPPAPIPDGVLRWRARPGSATAIAYSPVASYRPFVLALLPPGADSWVPPADVAEAAAGACWFVRAFDPASLEVLAEGALPGGR